MPDARWSSRILDRVSRRSAHTAPHRLSTKPSSVDAGLCIWPTPPALSKAVQLFNHFSSRSTCFFAKGFCLALCVRQTSEKNALNFPVGPAYGCLPKNLYAERKFLSWLLQPHSPIWSAARDYIPNTCVTWYLKVFISATSSSTRLSSKTRDIVAIAAGE